MIRASDSPCRGPLDSRKRSASSRASGSPQPSQLIILYVACAAISRCASDAIDERDDRLGLRLIFGRRSGVVAGTPRRPQPALREVAIEIDVVRVVARTGEYAVDVHARHDPRVAPGRPLDELVSRRSSMSCVTASSPWIAPNSSAAGRGFA